MTRPPRHDSMTRRPRATGSSADRGSVTIWMITSALVMIVLAGLAVDLGGQVHQLQRANDIAAQAARAGGQAITNPAIQGQLAAVDGARGVAAADTYLRASEVTGSARIGANSSVIVDTTGAYNTTFLSVIGISQLTVHGHAEQQTQRALGGTQR